MGRMPKNSRGGGKGPTVNEKSTAPTPKGKAAPPKPKEVINLDRAPLRPGQKATDPALSAQQTGKKGDAKSESAMSAEGTGTDVATGSANIATGSGSGDIPTIPPTSSFPTVKPPPFI